MRSASVIERQKTFMDPHHSLQTEKHLKSPIAVASKHNFQIGRLWYKLIMPDKAMQIINLNESLKNYQEFVEIGEEHRAIDDEMKEEIDISEEMANENPKILHLDFHWPFLYIPYFIICDLDV